MVKYKRFYKDYQIIKYYYYVEGDFSSEPGIIEVNITNQSINIITHAPDDYLRSFTPKDAKIILDGINGMRKEDGRPPITEDEAGIPKETSHYYEYGSHAVRDITKIINEQNIIPEKGTVAWY